MIFLTKKCNPLTKNIINSKMYNKYHKSTLMYYLLIWYIN